MKMLLAIVAVAMASLQSAYGQVNVNEPIAASEYATIIKQGFATNYFKTSPPGVKYRTQNIADIANRGFSNLRLRARADLDLYTAPYGLSSDFQTFLDKLDSVVNDCLAHDVIPIISWIHHKAEAFATDTEKKNYIEWWTLVAEKLKNKDYRLSFNLFTELDIDYCSNSCEHSLRRNKTAYHEWTRDVISAIRNTGGNNRKRIIIIASPDKAAKGLFNIDSSIYTGDNYMMAEFHRYASGPNKKKDSAKEWIGDGTEVGKDNVNAELELATTWFESTGIPLYFGAWMPEDNKQMALSEDEIKKFARYFVLKLKQKGIPWSLNVLDRYYDTTASSWITGEQEVLSNKPKVNFDKVLNTIVNNM